jgi:hypothetical protein
LKRSDWRRRTAATRAATSADPSAGGRQHQIGGADRLHFDVEVDAVEQRAGDLGLIVGGTARRAGAGEARISQMSAAARVHGGDQLDARGERHMRVGAGHRHGPGLQRLAQRIEHGALELGQLVEEQHAEMRRG